MKIIITGVEKSEKIQNFKNKNPCLRSLPGPLHTKRQRPSDRLHQPMYLILLMIKDNINIPEVGKLMTRQQVTLW